MVEGFALGSVPADLLIAGHTHGGQVRLPLIGAIMTLSRIPRRWAAGLTDLPGGGRLLVSRGTGMERGNGDPAAFPLSPRVGRDRLDARRRYAECRNPGSGHASSPVSNPMHRSLLPRYAGEYLIDDHQEPCKMDTAAWFRPASWAALNDGWRRPTWSPVGSPSPP